MDPSVPFFSSAAAAVALLVGVLLSGRAARRRLHVSLVGLSVVALVSTVYFAGRFGEILDLETAGWITPVHLSLARWTVVVLLAQIALGALTIRRPRTRRLHGRFAIWTMVMTLLAAITGMWMLLAAERL